MVSAGTETADDTMLEAIVDSTEDRIKIQNDLYRLELLAKASM